MSKVLINDTTMTDIADAIREKDGSTAQMYPSEMAMKIQGISTGEKRIIPNKLYVTQATVSGSGIQYCKSVAIIDGNTYKINTTEEKYLYGGTPIRFKHSATSDTGLPTIVGEETDEKLEGVPKIATGIYGYLMPSGGFSANGKGYAILHCINSSNGIGAITIDGKQIISGFSLSNHWNIRFDFNKSIKIADRNVDSRYSPVWEIYVYD